MPTPIEHTLPPMITTLNAMHLAQLTAYAYGLPPLFFCSQYHALEEQEIIEHCQQRIKQLLSTQETTLAQLEHLLADKAYFDAEEAHLRVAPLVEE